MADLGIGSYRTAWLLLHKIRSCFDESADYPLVGLVEVDEAWIGGAEKGVMHGRAASRKGIVVAGVEVTKRGPLGSARMRVIPNVQARSLVPFVVENIDPEAIVATDGWPAYNEIERLGYRRNRHVSKGPVNAPFHPVLDGVHLLISNLKTWLRGRFHGVSRKYLPAYVAEFMYRFNRRRSPPDLFGWVVRRLMSRQSLTFDDLKATADVCA
jgi:transposase-like protein